MADITDVRIELDRNQVNIRFDDTEYTESLEFNEQVLAELSHMREAGQPRDYGEKLFKSTFIGRAYKGVGILQNKINEQDGSSFRFILDIAPTAEALHQLWWECLVDPDDPSRIFSMSSTPFVRKLRSQINRPVIAREKLKILVVIANPTNLSGAPPEGWGLPGINVEAEKQVIEQALGQFGDRIEEVKFLPDGDSKERASLNNISKYLQGGKYHILHIIAHGGITNKKGYLLLERDEDGRVAPVQDSDIAISVRDRTDLRLVILASCYSAKQTTAGVFTGLAPKLYQAGVPAVIAMQGLINQATARRFCQRFYAALLNSTSGIPVKIDTAMNQARFQMRNDDVSSDELEKDAWGWAVPVLYLHGDGRLYNLARPASASAAQDISSRALRYNQSPKTMSGVNYPSILVSSTASPGLSARQGISQDLITAPNALSLGQVSAMISGKHVGPVYLAKKDAGFGSQPGSFLKVPH
jgi:hypothetical protein